MVTAKGECKICGETVSVGDAEMPPGIASEGVMEAIQEHIFQQHCDADLNLVEGEYETVGNAWTYV